MKIQSIFPSDASFKEKVQMTVSVCALTVAVSGTLLSYNLSHISLKEKRNEFISTMNIVKRSVMTVYSTASAYRQLSLVKLNDSRKKTKSYVPMTFSDISMLSDMVAGKDNVMKMTDESYNLYVTLKSLENEIIAYNEQFSSFYNCSQSEMQAFEDNVITPNLNLISSSALKILQILDEVEKEKSLKFIKTDTTVMISGSQRAYLKTGGSGD